MQLLRRLSFTMLLMSMMTLVACGGGDLTGDQEGSGGTSDGVTLSLSLSNTNITGDEPITVAATLSGGSVDELSNQLVTFTSTLGVFDPNAGTALTDANGVAQIILTAGNIRGAGEISASISSGQEATIGFTTQGDDTRVVGDINMTLSLVDTSGNEVTSITASKPGKIVAEVSGITDPVIVTFSSTVGEIPISTAITNDVFQASVDILAGGSLGAGTITASINSGATGELLLVVGSSSVTMGSGSPFVEGEAAISLEQISAGGTTAISVSILDDQGQPFTESVDVNFSSGCTSLSTPTAEMSAVITTSNGFATSTYLAKGCVGDDPINVTANAGGINLSASTTVNVLAADIGSVEFVSAAPEIIGILGTGALDGSESSVIKFRVLDTNSNPVNDQMVNFTLNSDVGGVQLIPASATTNNEGIVQTVVNSGTVATSVRVNAAIDGSDPVIASQSSLLVVSTGIPDQDSISLSADILNPEGWNRDGTEVVVTARLADAFNNPAPDGTAVSFTTEGGSIAPSCVTANGVCSVTWVSQYPRPEGNVLGDVNNIGHVPETSNTMGQKMGGRSTITATAIGEESFPDLNGNGRFDASEVARFLGNDTSGQPFDLSEAFVDHNEDGLYNPSEGGDVLGSGELEEFSDFNSDNLFTAKDSKYNGVLCSIPAHDGCANEKSVNVRRSLTLIMSGSSAYLETIATIDVIGESVDPLAIDDSDDDTITILGENVGGASVIISDLHNQPMPAGTVVTFTATVGSVVGPSSFTWPNDNHNGGLSFSVSVKGEKDVKSGSLLIEIKTPSGISTLYDEIGINIIDLL